MLSTLKNEKIFFCRNEVYFFKLNNSMLLFDIADGIAYSTESNGVYCQIAALKKHNYTNIERELDFFYNDEIIIIQLPTREKIVYNIIKENNFFSYISDFFCVC